MPTAIITKDMQFRYNLTSLSAIDHEVFLTSGKIEQRMLAVLGKVPEEDLEKVLEHVMLDIKSLDVGELTIERYLTQLRVLVELRNFKKETINDMALVGKIFEEERDILYIRGQYRGEARGVAIGKAQGEAIGKVQGERIKAMEIACQMLTEKEPLDKIARYTKLSIEELEALKAE